MRGKYDECIVLVAFFVSLVLCFFMLTRCEQNTQKQKKNFLESCIQVKPTAECAELLKKIY